jgi:uncharacterized membrane protein (UPF0127 family)
MHACGKSGRVRLPPSGPTLSFRTVKQLRVLAFVLVFTTCSKGQGATQVTPPVDTTVATTSVSFPGGTVVAIIASRCASRLNGLMNVTTLGANAGMLFVYQENHDSLDVSFYMKNTPLPLSIAFIDASKQVINTADMAARDSVTMHHSSRPFRYALEVNLGWFAAHGAAAGTPVTFTLPAGTIMDPYPCVP